jgi:hypothetical protein
MGRAKPALAIIALVNIVLLSRGLWSSFVTAEEARQLPAGLAVWRTETFALANDSPPLARTLAAVPMLFTKTYSYFYDLKTTDIPFSSCLREREEEFGAHFAYANAAKYLGLVRAARMTNVLWWLLGAWVIGRWARELYGDAATVLGLALWCFGPNVLSYEQVATPVFPSAVAVALATYAFDRYLKAPSWGRAIVAGLALGVAQLVDFAALVLYVIWPLLALARHCTRSDPAPVRSNVIDSIGQAATILLLSVWIINLGYGFQGSASSLEDHDFVSRSLGADPRSGSPPSGGEPTGNRFRGTWAGRLIVPLPSDYVEGLDRCWHDLETAGSPHDSQKGLAVREPSPLATLGAKVPMGVWGLVLWSLVLAIARHPSSAPWVDELALWLPATSFLALAASAASPLSPARGIVLAAPFGAILASKLGYFRQPGRWRVGWLVMALALWAIGSSLSTHPRSRAYLNEAIRRPDRVAIRMRHGPFDGGPDLLALKEWLRTHPEVHLRGMAVRDPIGPRITGLRYPPPPGNPGPSIAGDASYTRRIGPDPGYYTLDPYSLKEAKYNYFQHLIPVAVNGPESLRGY